MKYIYISEKYYQLNDKIRFALVITTEERLSNRDEITISTLEFATAEDREAARKALKKAYDVF